MALTEAHTIPLRSFCVCKVFHHAFLNHQLPTKLTRAVSRSPALILVPDHRGCCVT
jgi:hypothetical protein